MQKIITDLELDFQQNNSEKNIFIQQGDANSGRIIYVKLYNNGIIADLSGVDNTATLYASVGGVITAEGLSLIVDHETNIVSIPITAALSSIAGVEKCVIRVSSGFGIVHSAKFNLLVGESPVSNDMPYVVPTANLIDDIEGLQGDISDIQRTIDTYANTYGRLLISNVFPEIHKYSTMVTIHVSDTASLQGNAPYYDITCFQPTGLQAFKFHNNVAEYVRFTYTKTDNTAYPSPSSTVQITFSTTFEATDDLILYFYPKPYISSQISSTTHLPAVSTIWTGTQTEYDALSSYDSRTLYIIEEASS